MAAHHERSKYPPVRMSGAKAVSDPIRAPVTAATSSSLADMKDDLPWEAKK
jgi:hypothetical protein